MDGRKEESHHHTNVPAFRGGTINCTQCSAKKKRNKQFAEEVKNENFVENK